MRFPYSAIFLFGLLFLGLIAIGCKPEPKTSNDSLQIVNKDYILTVDRGAFHFDSFVLSNDTLSYIPQENSNHPNILYNTLTKTAVDSAVVATFFNKIDSEIFWELYENYTCSSTCTSELRITFKTNDKAKTVICEDYERDCPEIIKYIEQKVVELEGNRLIRIYNPG